MPKWKIQAVEPDTCNQTLPARILTSAGPQPTNITGCRYLEIWDVEAPIHLRTHSVSAFERICPDHEDDVPDGLLLWVDGNWKPLAEYIEYQRAWFKHQNYKEWQSNRITWNMMHSGLPATMNPYIAMPPQLQPFAEEPKTTGSVSSPSNNKKDALNRVYQWNRFHNLQKNAAIAIANQENIQDISWNFEGHGDDRILRLNLKGSNGSADRIFSAMTIQFGRGKTVI